MSERSLRTTGTSTDIFPAQCLLSTSLGAAAYGEVLMTTAAFWSNMSSGLMMVMGPEQLPEGLYCFKVVCLSGCRREQWSGVTVGRWGEGMLEFFCYVAGHFQLIGLFLGEVKNWLYFIKCLQLLIWWGHHPPPYYPCPPGATNRAQTSQGADKEHVKVSRALIFWTLWFVGCGLCGLG